MDPSTARKVAIANFQKYNLLGIAEISEIVPLGLNNDTLIYVFKFAKTGFVFVSSYYAAPPVLGQCYTDVFDTSRMPPGLLYLLEKYKHEMSYIKENKLKPTKETENKWNNILSGEYNSSKSYTVGTNLVPTEWGPYDMYETPEHPVFCTGIAMAQILYYWNCRIPGDYMWINMDTINEDAYNALLIYDCCVQCERPCCPGSSFPWLARDAFVYFGISNSADVKWRISHLFNWKNMLEDEIDLERPLLYSAGSIIPIEGHSWVIDGYNEYDKFWCNWGWSGTYNGFYSLGGFSPGNDNYNEAESAIFNVVPVHQTGIEVPQLTAKTVPYNIIGNVIMVPEAYGATSYDWSTQYGTITGNGRSVMLYSDFTTIVQVRAYNNRCQIYSTYDSETITIDYGSITGAYVLCSSGSQYSIPYVPPTATITWSDGSYVNRISPQGSNPCTFAASGSGSSWIGAQINTSHGSKTLSNYSIWAGKFENTYVSGTVGVCPDQLYTYTAQVPGGHQPSYSYSWTYPSNWYNYGQVKNMINLKVPMYNPYYGPVRVSITNACGTSGYSGFTTYPGYNCGGYGYYSMYPNPASDEVTITINEPVTIVTEDANVSEVTVSKAISADQVTYTIRIYNSLGTLVSSATRTGTSFDIPLPNLRDGTYIVEVSDGKNSYREQLIIKHE